MPKGIVVFIDDQPDVLCSFVKVAIDNYDPYIYSSYNEFSLNFKHTLLDVLIIDHDLGDNNFAIDCLDNLREKFPKTPIVLTSRHTLDDSTLNNYLNKGIIQFLPKPSNLNYQVYIELLNRITERSRNAVNCIVLEESIWKLFSTAKIKINILETKTPSKYRNWRRVFETSKTVITEGQYSFSLKNDISASLNGSAGVNAELSNPDLLSLLLKSIIPQLSATTEGSISFSYNDNYNYSIKIGGDNLPDDVEQRTYFASPLYIFIKGTIEISCDTCKQFSKIDFDMNIPDQSQFLHYGWIDTLDDGQTRKSLF